MGQGLSFQDTYGTPPSPGSSIGPDGSCRSGTLGCYLKIERLRSDGSSQEAHVVGLTCHHILCHSKHILPPHFSLRYASHIGD